MAVANQFSELERRVLLVAPTRRDAEVTSSLLARAHLTCVPCADFRELRREAARGVHFTEGTGAAARPLLGALLDAEGPRRMALFFELLDLLLRDEARRPLASVGYQPTPAEYSARPMNHVLAHIGCNLGSDLREADMAALSGYTPAAFSRAFKRHTGLGFVTYVNSLRINRACEMLMRGGWRVADICYEVGFNNLSNFNRQFLAHKRMPPSAFRQQHAGLSQPSPEDTIQ